MSTTARTATPSATASVRVEGLRVSFRGVEALKGLEFSFGGPQVVGILGPNGAGKSTLLDVLEGLRRPTAGRVWLLGQALGEGYPRGRVGAVLQREFVTDRMSAREYAALFSTLQGVRDGAPGILREAGLEHRAEVPLDRLSGGEAQRLHLHTALAHDPDLLFLDEPSAHLDPMSRQRFGERLKAEGRRRTVVLCTHDLTEAEAVCDRVLFLVDGVLRREGTVEALLEAVPPEARHTGTLADAFFHACGARLTDKGDLA
ncbi:MAG: ABC transporter ATP-binding protein [Deltaproteobacteria bacterium]|nr:ABC transporter ATP-binding protein [Deltaproteobacteria bacterium]